MFAPKSIELSGDFTLGVPPDTAFQLFSPVGEKSWVPEWNPELLHPPGVTWERGLIFRTQEERGEAIWVVTGLDPEHRRVEYHRVEAGRYVAKVGVSCQACADLQTEVRVTYTFVGLSESGNEEIAAMSAKLYEEKMSRWLGWIQRHLDRVKVIRLIAIDDHLRQVVWDTCGDFAEVYGASLGESKGLVREVVSQTLALLLKAPRAAEWGGYLVADPRQAMVVGTCGFKHGPEADGTVEIAYFTFPKFEGRGYATAMARELLKRALQSGAVREVIAHTLPERNPSTRVLEKVGLQRAGEAHDAEVGRVWRWACRRLPAILLCVALLAVGPAWAHQDIDFTPEQTLQEQASALFLANNEH